MFKRFIFLGYYILKTNVSELKASTDYCKQYGHRRLKLYPDMLIASLRYNISIMDYFYFRFFEKPDTQRKKWAGTGFMYEYQLKMNPKENRNILEDKILFLQHYAPFIEREWCSLNAFSKTPEKVQKIISNPSGKIVVKGAKGQIGAEVCVLPAKNYTPHTLKIFMLKNQYDLLEEAVVQHPELMALSPSGLNTIRLITQLNKQGKVDIIAARIRITVNSTRDNLGVGNLACAIDKTTGEIISDGIHPDLTRDDKTRHPVTHVKFKGYKIPH